MKRANALGFLALAAAIGGGCSGDGLTVDPERPPAAADMTVVFLADGGTPVADAAVGPCDDRDPLCHHFLLGPAYGKPFPLGTPWDDPPDPAVAADNVTRDENGWLRITPWRRFAYVWVAEDQAGTVSKVDSVTMKEIARYRTVTCFSRAMTGSHAACDGTNGCCAADSLPQWQNRKNKLPDGPAQQVQLDDNSPSRTSVDFNGDLFIANRALGGQASVTKIAMELSGCKDRNKSGRIDTSNDVNKDGRIDPNDPKEFLGLDDECILWTTNQGARGSTGRPLSLGPGLKDLDPSDAFAGGYETGKLYRIDGTSGKVKDEWQLPDGCHPYGLAIDSQGFGWAPNDGMGPLCYFDTHHDASVGKARGTMTGYGVALDRDQNVWVGGGVARYTPDRSKGFASLGNGWWTRIDGLAGQGIAADLRSVKKYFVWSASANGVVRIPASDIPLPKGMDTTVPLDPNWPKINAPAYGVTVDTSQNVVAAPQSGVVVRTNVDQNGDFMQPDVLSPPQNGTLCPAGDRCDVGAHLDAYSDFTGFAVRSGGVPRGYWSYVVRSACLDEKAPTTWFRVTWDADVPANTSISMHARSGTTPKPDASWGAWTSDFKVSPVEFEVPGALVPNGPQDEAGYLQIEFGLRTNDRNAAPRLKSFDLAYRCET